MALKVADIVASRGRITAWCAPCKRMYVLADPWQCRCVSIDADILDIQRSLKCKVCKTPGEVWVSFPTSEVLETKGRMSHCYNNTPYEHGSRHAAGD
ncbi:hypothetical protein [Falsirhodobacter sp. 1013]|uniref:hypothetical protein n=1 Tax=Falsirhodobacter sp. 1013 TaxID=3417566 RepID=UPI003EBD6C72